MPSVPRQCGDQQLMCRWELLLAACAGLAAVSEPELGWQTTLHCTTHQALHTTHILGTLTLLLLSCHREASLQLDCWIDLATGGSGSCKVIE